jgi:hypothetical protein
VTLGAQAVALAEQSDMLNLRAELWSALGASRRAAGSVAEAEAAFVEAVRIYSAKGNVAAAGVGATATT